MAKIFRNDRPFSVIWAKSISRAGNYRRKTTESSLLLRSNLEYCLFSCVKFERLFKSVVRETGNGGASCHVIGIAWC